MNILLFADIGRNAISRVYPFAKKLSEDHNVLVAGLLRRGEQPYSGYKHLMNFYPIYSLKDYIKLAKMKWEIVHCFKALYTTWFPSLILKYFKRIPLVLDQDDMDYVPNKLMREAGVKTTIWNEVKPTAIANKMHELASAVTVHTSVLQNLYGGTIIRTGADLDLFNKENAKGWEELKNKEGYEDYFLIPFIGQPRMYKGVDITIKAISKLKNSKIKFLQIGQCDDLDFKSLYQKYKDYICLHKPISHDEIPRYYAMSGVVVLAQKCYGLWNLAQIPTKLCEAMAMECPLIISNKGDYPEIVGDTAILFNGVLNQRESIQEDVSKLADLIQWTYENPKDAKRLGEKARKRYVEMFNWNILKKQVLKVYNSVL